MATSGIHPGFWFCPQCGCQALQTVRWSMTDASFCTLKDCLGWFRQEDFPLRPAPICRSQDCEAAVGTELGSIRNVVEVFLQMVAAHQSALGGVAVPFDVLWWTTKRNDDQLCAEFSALQRAMFCLWRVHRPSLFGQLARSNALRPPAQLETDVLCQQYLCARPTAIYFAKCLVSCGPGCSVDMLMRAVPGRARPIFGDSRPRGIPDDYLAHGCASLSTSFCGRIFSIASVVVPASFAQVRSLLCIFESTGGLESSFSTLRLFAGLHAF